MMKKVILMTFLLVSPIIVFGQTTVKIYFGNEKFNPNIENCMKVYPVNRKVQKTPTIAKTALEELFKGTTKDEEAKGYTSFAPDETKGILKSIKIKNKAAYINFNKAVYEQLGNATTSCGGGQFFSMVEKTLFQFPTIKKIFYAIEENPRDFYEWIQVGECPKELKNCSNKNF
jgi:Sporulation and spore germination